MLKDPFGSPYKKGMTVLTNGYQSAGMTEITTIDKVNKTTIAVIINAYEWEYPNTPKPTRRLRKFKKRVLRRPDQVIVFEQQLQYNKENYPENFI